MRLYIAGPMTRKPEFNYPAFDLAAEMLQANGYETISPADHDREGGFDPTGMTGHEDLTGIFNLADALAWDLDQVTHADGVAVLDGWEKSRGAKAEVATAWAVGVKVATVMQWTNAPELREYITDVPKAAAASTEIRTTSATGGEKGTKPERHDLIPVGALSQVARHYGVGARKYAAHNWRRGYEWSKSYSALQRHATAFWAGEDIDAETDSPHMAAVAFHALALLTFLEEQRAFDDRYAPVSAQNTPIPTTTPEPDTRPAEPPQKPAEGPLLVGGRFERRKGRVIS
jgi:hypothetical protein